jgi:hypothetical protein
MEAVTVMIVSKEHNFRVIQGSERYINVRTVAQVPEGMRSHNCKNGDLMTPTGKRKQVRIGVRCFRPVHGRGRGDSDARRARNETNFRGLSAEARMR